MPAGPNMPLRIFGKTTDVMSPTSALSRPPIDTPPCAPPILEYKLKLTDNGYPHGRR
jgi:hypothetical protein